MILIIPHHNGAMGNTLGWNIQSYISVLIDEITMHETNIVFFIGYYFYQTT